MQLVQLLCLSMQDTVLMVSELWRLHQEWKEQEVGSPYSPATRPWVTTYISPSQECPVCLMKTVSLFVYFSGCCKD